ncbi:Crp/Fnr family transcriptional regulator [Brevibacillus sp. NRS-1366]|uniref:Crp/Fnr family transcriptional regulator n=1 Tax=Brevibacillus sp. NRS-1366 TaxID=3233899 RepID=UPI003D1ED31E
MLHLNKDTSVIQSLDLFGERRTYPAHKIIIDQEREGHKGILLLSGSARAFLLTFTGEERLLFYPSKGSFLGETAMFYNQTFKHWNLFVETVTPCEVLEMTKKDIMYNVANYPEFFTLLMEAASVKYINFLVRLQSSSHPSISLLEQIIYVLFSTVTEKQLSPFSVRITHEEISQIIDRSRVAVTNTLGKLQKQGLIELGRGHIRIINPKELWAMIGE